VSARVLKGGFGIQMCAVIQYCDVESGVKALYLLLLLFWFQFALTRRVDRGNLVCVYMHYRGGVLTYLLPTTYDFTENDLPVHPCLQLTQVHAALVHC
jgi:hypothetical protein